MTIHMNEPAPLPVALAEVKAFLRVAAGDEDALLTGLARAAADMCEAFTGRALIDRAVEEVLGPASAWTRLGAAPVRAITEVALLAADGTATPLDPQAYAIDIDASGDGWVRVTDGGGAASGWGRGRRIRVSYQAGMAADADGLPEAIRHGVVRLAAHLYAGRDRPDCGGPPAAVTALWQPWRRMRLN